MLDFEEISEILAELRIGDNEIEGNLFLNEDHEQKVTQSTSAERGESNGR